MGDRYFLNVTCPHCDAKNDDVYFAPTCGMMGNIRCETCDRLFYIGDDFSAHKDPQSIDMRKYSMWGDEVTEKTGLPAVQTNEEG